MEHLLAILHSDQDGALDEHALQVVSAAAALSASLGCSFDVGVSGVSADRVAAQLAGCGAEHCYTLCAEAFAPSRYGSDMLAATALAQAATPTIFLAPATSRMSRIAGGLAQRLGGCVDAHVTAVDAAGEDVEVERWYYRQRILARQTRKNRPWVITLESGCHPPYAAQGDAASVTAIPAPDAAECTRSTVLGVRAPSEDAKTIRPDAKLLFVAGAGWTKKQPDGQVHLEDARRLILGLVGQAKASLGSSKSLVDLSGEGQAVLDFMSHLHQVGQTGATPRHPKGLATCCHGEEPHVVGWRFIKERRAVNLDANCGWAQGKADVLYVADAFKVVESLLKLL